MNPYLDNLLQVGDIERLGFHHLLQDSRLWTHLGLVVGDAAVGGTCNNAYLDYSGKGNLLFLNEKQYIMR